MLGKGLLRHDITFMIMPLKLSYGRPQWRVGLPIDLSVIMNICRLIFQLAKLLFFLLQKDSQTMAIGFLFFKYFFDKKRENYGFFSQCKFYYSCYLLNKFAKILVSLNLKKKTLGCHQCTRMECMFNSVSHMPCKTPRPWALLAYLTQNKIAVVAWQLRHMSVE